MPTGRWWWFLIKSSSCFSAWSKTWIRSEYLLNWHARYCCWRILSAWSIVDKVFSIFSTLEGSFSQNYNFEQILWTAWLNSPIDLKSYRRSWVHSCVASGKITAFCCSYLVWRASHSVYGSSFMRYSNLRSAWMWFLIVYKAYICINLRWAVIPFEEVVWSLKDRVTQGSLLRPLPKLDSFDRRGEFLKLFPGHFVLHGVKKPWILSITSR